MQHQFVKINAFQWASTKSVWKKAKSYLYFQHKNWHGEGVPVLGAAKLALITTSHSRPFSDKYKVLWMCERGMDSRWYTQGQRGRQHWVNDLGLSTFTSSAQRHLIQNDLTFLTCVSRRASRTLGIYSHNPKLLMKTQSKSLQIQSSCRAH